jgi:hypothetical protein
MLRIGTIGACLVATCASPVDAASRVPADGEVTVAVNECVEGPALRDVPTPGCSYVAIAKPGGGAYFAYPTAGGAIVMRGTIASGSFALPGEGQSLPGVGLAGGLATVDVAKNDISGSVAGDGAVSMHVPYSVTFTALGLSCTVSGSASLSSSDSDSIGGGAGRPLDEASGSFAVAATSGPPATTGALCELAGDAIDVSRGIGWYIDGTVSTPQSRPVMLRQTASPALPDRVKRKGRTVLLKRPVVTNAGQPATVRVSWGVRKSAKGSRRDHARLITGRGKVVLRTTGTARRLFVRLTLRASATAEYDAYRVARLWRVS